MAFVQVRLTLAIRRLAVHAVRSVTVYYGWKKAGAEKERSYTWLPMAFVDYWRDVQTKLFRINRAHDLTIPVRMRRLE